MQGEFWARKTYLCDVHHALVARAGGVPHVQPGLSRPLEASRAPYPWHVANLWSSLLVFACLPFLATRRFPIGRLHGLALLLR